ncbi:MAG: AAA family ATPase [Spirochaetales bacterium]|nr:AAA family ATPase [Spirochaetales bacterium]
MRKLPPGIQTFSKIIEEDFLYVDKTKDILQLLSKGQVFFLSRPRRFGKSLLISTLKEIFSGNRQLFQGLYIYDKSPPILLLP